MKKNLGITVAQRMLKPSFLALIIAGSRFLTTASAVRWTVNFKDREGGAYIKSSDLVDFKDLINAWGAKKSREDQNRHEAGLIRALIHKIQGIGLSFKKHLDSDDNSKVTILLKDGILKNQEAKKLLNGVKMSFNIEFINCSGTLDLNEDLKNYADLIRFRNCKFKTAPNCFKGTKALEFLNTNLTPTDGWLGIDKTTEVGADKISFVLPQNVWLVNAIALEQKGKSIAEPSNKNLGSISNNVIESEKNFETETSSRMQDVDNKLLSLQMQYDCLNEELKEIKRNNKDDVQYKSRITELEEEIKRKDLIIGNLKAEVKRLENNKESIRKELVDTIHNRNKEQEVLSSSYKATQEQLEDAKRNNETYKTVIEEMKNKNAQLKKENEKFLKNSKCAKNRMEVLETSKSKLEAINEKLEADNNALREEIRKSSETVQSAGKTLMEFKNLGNNNRRLKENLMKKKDEIKILKENREAGNGRILELESLLTVASNFINTVHPLLQNLRKSDEYIRNTLSEIGYDKEAKKYNQSLKKLYESDEERKKRDKKGHWIDFDKLFPILDDHDDNEGEKEEKEKENDETYWGGNPIYRGRRNFYDRGYRGNGSYFRGNYRGRGNGQMRINRGRGGKYGGEQRAPFNSEDY